MSDSTNITDTGDATLLTLSNQNATNLSWVDLDSTGTTIYTTSDSTTNISLIDPNQITQGTNMLSTNTTHVSNAPDSNLGIPGELFFDPSSGNMWVKSFQGWKMITVNLQGDIDPHQKDVTEKGKKRKLKCFK